MRLHFTLNGEPTEMEARPSDLLVDLLRVRLQLQGTRTGCLQGQCGSCIVIMDGALAPSCLVPGFRVHDSEVVTIEGLMQTGEYQEIEKGLARAGAEPCRFCSAGKFLSIHALLIWSPHPTEQEVQDILAGVWCRCTGYSRLTRAIEHVVENRGRNHRG